MSHTHTVKGLTPASGFEDAPAPQPVGADGQAGDHWVLSPEDRAEGFVRPVRESYRHVGRAAPRSPLRDLTEEEAAHFSDVGFVKFEPYPEDEKPVAGRFWTQEQIDAVGKGCGGSTRMPRAIAETYARQPSFYGSTFCCQCGKYLKVGADGEFVWEDGSRVGT